MENTFLWNCKVKYIRPQFNNLKECLEDENYVYIGRGGIVFIDGERYPKKDSVWANPFKMKTNTLKNIEKDESDDTSSQKYFTKRDILMQYKKHIIKKIQDENLDILQLKDKTLMCWCVEEKTQYNSDCKSTTKCVCHGQILLRLLYKKIKNRNVTQNISQKKSETIKQSNKQNNIREIFSKTDVYEYKNLSKNIHISLYYNFLDSQKCQELLDIIINNHFSDVKLYNKDGNPTKVRHSMVFGEIEAYKYEIRGEKIESPVIPWEYFPELLEIREKIYSLLCNEVDKDNINRQTFHTCSVHVYMTGDTQIKPHRDKEMKSGTIIASISLGSTRTMRFQRYENTVDFELLQGTLCLIRPPTNDYWLHSIPQDDTKTIRVSIIFRNCEGFF